MLHLDRLAPRYRAAPTAASASALEALETAMRRLDDAAARAAGALRRRGRFRSREELALAKQRDQRALGEALAAGHDEPEPEAAAIEKEIERNANRRAR